MSKIEKVLYTGKMTTVGGREGSSTSSDGRLDVLLSPPGSNGPGTNPEQLLAAGWSACYLGAMRKIAQQLEVTLPADLTVNAEVDLGVAGAGYELQARFNVSIPGIDAAIAQQLIDQAHTICPYSKALHGNIGVETRLV